MIKISIEGDFPREEVSDVITSALKRDVDIASYKKNRYQEICHRFEKKYGMPSDDFMVKFESGKLDDRDDYFDWYAAKKGLDIWDKKIRILTSIV